VLTVSEQFMLGDKYRVEVYINPNLKGDEHCGNLGAIIRQRIRKNSLVVWAEEI
jgi:hypothetical protein